jgi:hypothetical protein
MTAMRKLLAAQNFGVYLSGRTKSFVLRRNETGGTVDEAIA